MSNKVNFENLTFEKFRELACLPDLSVHEKVGFPIEYREGKEADIFDDVSKKLSGLNEKQKTILEIGPGCSNLPKLLVKVCEHKDHTLHFVDSPEMLQHLPEGKRITKWAGYYPNIPKLIKQLRGKIDIIIAYSVIQYVFAEGNLWNFLDSSLALLSDGGEILFGDIPNITMRKRFFVSNEGIECHKKYTGKDDPPSIQFNQLEAGFIDDSVVFSILSRARAQGYHAWVLPQDKRLPMANRREDILIRKP